MDHISSSFQARTCCVTQFQKLQVWSMFGSHFKHVWITFQAHFKHVWITFQARFKNEHAVLPSFNIYVCQSHLKQFWSMFGLHFKHILITFQALFKHVLITFQDRTCCVTQFQNSCADHNIRQYKPIK
jgi:hypothetical protein